MKKNILLLGFYVIFFLSCSDEISTQINGQWQLKTIEEEGVISPVDTVFYAFQRGAIFSFTILNPNSNIESFVSYGYVTFPAEDKMTISMDTSWNENGYFWNIHSEFLKHSGWSGYDMMFNVKEINNKWLVIESENKTYTLKKH